MVETISAALPVIPDADRHVMEPHELDDSVSEQARAGFTSTPVDKVAGKLADTLAPGAHAAARIPEPEQNIFGAKGYEELGPVNSAECGRALDLLGVPSHLVSSTFSAIPLIATRDLDVLYGGAAGRNRTVAAFDENDPRLLATR